MHVVSQNILHGEACPADSDKCHLPDRVAFFSEQIAKNCPDIVALQEANQRIVDELTKDVKSICDGAYHVVWDKDPGTDREVVLTQHPVLAQQRFRLAGPLRTALWVRVATDAGAVDFWTAHLASGSDDRPCDHDTCPAPCQSDDMLNTCQGRELGQLAYAHRAPDSLLILAGDFNAHPTSPTLRALEALGLEDTHLAAGNAECDPSTGTSCTGGRDDTSVAGLSDPQAKQKERIDYVLLDPLDRCELTKPTGLFEEAAATGRSDGLAHPSDHTGVQATLGCQTSAAQKAAGAKATTSSTTSTTSAAGTIDPATKQAVSAAFGAVFSGTSDLDTTRRRDRGRRERALGRRLRLRREPGDRVTHLREDPRRLAEGPDPRRRHLLAAARRERGARPPAGSGGEDRRLLARVEALVLRRRHPRHEGDPGRLPVAD